MAQVHWDIFDEVYERYDGIISDLETIRDLIAPRGEKDWFNDEGEWTEKGVSVLGTYIQQLETYKNSLAGANEELAKLQKEYQGNEAYYKNLGIDSEQELYDKRKEWNEEQQKSLKGISDSQQSVVDMYESQIDAIEEWSNKAVEAYNDYIDVVKESLDAERDLYEFKKSTSEKTKNIAELERKIASLSGSDATADVAERRKLQGELADAKSDLDDHYYSHAQDARQQALDDEAQAYEESMNNYIEKLRTTLDEAQLNMDLFMEQVINAVMLNAATIAEQYNNTGLAISEDLTVPWKEAAQAMAGYEGDALAQMNAWTAEGGFFFNFSNTATNQLKSPWDAGKDAANSFRESIKTTMKEVIDNVKINVSTALDELQKVENEIKKINDSNLRPSNNNGGNNYNNNGNKDGSIYGTEYEKKSSPRVEALQEILNAIFGANLEVDGIWGSKTKEALQNAQRKMRVALNGNWIAVDGKYTNDTRNAIATYINQLIDNLRKEGNGSSMNGQVIQRYMHYRDMLPMAMHAKGTLKTKKDELAITDESWIGEEITLAAGKNGQLQYLKKGSAVMPADISANLIEWGKLNPNMMNVGNMADGINLMSNYINKPELSFSFDSLVHVDNCSQDTIKDLEKMVDNKINQFTRKLNYSIKGYVK